MGRKEADIDGIKYYEDPITGKTVYIVPCSRCGGIKKTQRYGRGLTYICDACRLGEKEQRNENAKAWFETIERKGERRFNAALDEIQAQVKDFDKYEKAIKAASRAMEKYGSIPEAMVAVELVRNKHKIIPQQKVGRYRIDFYVPEEKFAVEVDGDTFHRNNRNSDREATIQLSLGLDVKIIHIPAELIRKDIQKLEEYIQKSITNRNHGTKK